MSTLPAPSPLVTVANKEFWDATAQRRFLLQRCDACDLVVWFPRRHCPECWQENLRTFDASGKGTVYSFTIIRKGVNEYKDVAPFVYAYVELEEGPRVMTNIVHCAPEDVRVGMPVSIVWDVTERGPALYRFAPAG